MKFPAMAGAGTFTAPINQVPQEAASTRCTVTLRENFASSAWMASVCNAAVPAKQ
jgi:hypothetical protein